MKLNAGDYTIEPCPWCGSEQVIYAMGVTRCVCGKPLAPCTMCDYCNYNTCPYGCNGTDRDAYKKCDHDTIPSEMQAEIYKLL